MFSQTWDEAAGSALSGIYAAADALGSSGDLTLALAALSSELEMFIGEHYDRSCPPQGIAIETRWRAVGARAVVLGNILGAEVEFAECFAVLLKKHRDYGTANIWRFSRPDRPGGLLVRVWDKMARMHHLIEHQLDPANEPLRDSVLDLIGYSTIGILVQRNTFLLGDDRRARVPRP